MNTMPDTQMQVPVDDPNADTEWNDILRKHGIIPERPVSPTKEIEENIMAAAEEVYANRFDYMNQDQLEELEDDLDPEFWAAWRQTKINEMQEQAKGTHGSVYPLQRSEYEREITEASQKAPVLVLLTADNPASVLGGRKWAELAKKWIDLKFCQIRAVMALDKPYAVENCPTFVAYRNGDILSWKVGLSTLGGVKMGVRNLEEWMVSVGVVDSSDDRLHEVTYDDDAASSGHKSDSDDSDWD